jgi:hypothetical protein
MSRVGTGRPTAVATSGASPPIGTPRPDTVSRDGPAASSATRAADIRSEHEAKRRSGDLSSALAITASSPSGSSGRSSEGFGGGSERCA